MEKGAIGVGLIISPGYIVAAQKSIFGHPSILFWRCDVELRKMGVLIFYACRFDLI